MIGVMVGPAFRRATFRRATMADTKETWVDD
jgi:hypothetical protein